MKASIDPARTWFVARSKPGQTLKAMTAIREAGFDVYCPRKRISRWSRGKQIRLEFERPLMPPYLFAGFEDGERHFGRVRDLDEVSGFLTNAEGSPLFVPVKIIEAIWLAEIAGEYDETDRAKKARAEATERLFPPGTAVRLMNDLKGILAGVEGIAKAVKRDNVLVEFGALKAWVDASKIEAR